MSSKYAKRLDRSRDFGTSHPPENGVFYYQDGVPFDHEGYVVDAVAEETLSEEQLKKLAQGKKHAAPAKPQAKPQTAPKPPKPPAPGDEDGEGDEGGGEDELNLEMWLRGEIEYPFADVQKAVKARYHKWITGKRDLVLFLVEDEKVVEPDALAEDFKTLIGDGQ